MTSKTMNLFSVPSQDVDNTYCMPFIFWYEPLCFLAMYRSRAITGIFTGINTRRSKIIRYLSISAVNMSRITDAIKEDHRELEQYYDNIVNAEDNDAATRWQNQFTWELARHSIGEELVVYPAFEKHLGYGGVEMADKDRDEHQGVRGFKLFLCR